MEDTVVMEGTVAIITNAVSAGLLWFVGVLHLPGKMMREKLPCI